MYAIVLHAGRISMNLWTFEPSVYLDLWEDHVKHDQAKQLARRQQLERELYSSGDFYSNNKEL